MPSEAKRAVVRIGTNYTRLFIALASGVVLTPVLLAWLGKAGFGLISLLGASVGIAAMAQDVIRQSLIRELASGYHGDDQAFRRAYNSAYVISAIAAAITAASFAVIYFLIPMMSIDADLVAGARWLVGAEGVYITIRVLLAPAFNMYVVMERFVFHNYHTAQFRSNYLIAALILYLGFGFADVGDAVRAYAILAASMNLALLVIAVVRILFIDRRLIPSAAYVSRETLGEISHTFGWNTGVIVAMNLHERIPLFIVNIVFGLGGNALYGLALRLAAYVRMATLGVTFGLDAVASRLSAADDHERIKALIRQATRLNAMAAIAGGMFVFVLAEPLLRLWVGRHLENPGQDIPATVTLVQIMMFALMSRAISDGWIKVLYGAGHVKRYAPLVLMGGVLNPVLAIGLLYVVPSSVRFNMPAVAFAAVFTVVHMLILPIVGARCLKVTFGDMLWPIAKPAMAAIVPGIALTLMSVWIGRGPGWSLVLLGVVGGVYGLLFGLGAWVIVLTREERGRVMWMVKRERGEKEKSDGAAVSEVK
jgi:O-antigen/teichoic acid export membrane protein